MNYLKTILLASGASLTLLTSCEKSASNEFQQVNGNVAEKRLKKINFISTDNDIENKTVNFVYDGNNRLSNVSDGTDTSHFVYQNNDLSTVTGGGDNLNIERLFESPYNAYEVGQVLNYDTNGNPQKILFLDEQYNYNTHITETKEYTAEISYDNVHNPYFYTLKAGGMIKVLDGVRFNFSSNPQSSQIVQARLLFPSNNPSKIVYKDSNGQLVHEIIADYVYDGQNYPSSVSITSKSHEENTTSVYTATYEYVN